MVIFDLDQTLIDSTIRENLSNVEGKLCLQTYFAIKADAQNGISTDRLTELGEWLENEGYLEQDFAILTARAMDSSDLNSLAVLMPNTVINAKFFVSRNTIHKYGGDENQQDSGLYKMPVLKAFKAMFGKVAIVDDCHKVLNMARSLNCTAIKAQIFWTIPRQECGKMLAGYLK